MRYCDCFELIPGMVLAKPLYSETNELLLSSGYAITAALIRRIQRLGLSPVCIEEAGTEQIIISELVEERTLRAAHQSVKEVFDQAIQTAKNRTGQDVDNILNDLKAAKFTLPIQEVKKTMNLLIDELLDNMSSDWNILPIKFMTGNYFRHGMDVALLSALIGVYFQLNYRELKHLALGAVLHDLGMTLIPELMEKKNSDFTPQDLRQYQQHPRYGVNLLQATDESMFIEQQCIQQHHEEPGGKGFPQGLVSSLLPPNQRSNQAANEIFRMAEIIHVADAYLNLTTGGWSVEALGPDEAITYVVRSTPTCYNPHIVSALSRVVIRFPKGVQVRVLKNASQRYVGCLGVVAVPNKEAPHKPVLILIADRLGKRITPLQVDFAAEKMMEIQLAL